MDFFDKIKFDSLAKKKDARGLLESLVTRGRYDSKCYEYILEKLVSNFSLVEIKGAYYSGGRLTHDLDKHDFDELNKRLGDDSTLREIYTLNSSINVQVVMTIYERCKSEELRNWIIDMAMTRIQNGITKYGLIRDHRSGLLIDSASSEDFLIVDRLEGWSTESADLLIKRIDYYEETIIPILIRMGMPVVEKLIRWLDNKKEGYIHQTWHRGNYNSMEDSYGEGWIQSYGDRYLIQNQARRILFEITGEKFGTAAQAKKWLKEHLMAV